LDTVFPGNWLAFVVTCFAIELTPGPNMAYLAVITIDRGRRAGFAAVFGVAIGLLVVGLAAALGLAAIIANARWLYEALRWGGVIYLLWLAWEGWQGQENSPGKADVAAQDSTFFLRGLITNLLNPKAALFYIAILPTFVDDSRGLLGQTVMLSVVYVAIATVIHCAIVLLGVAARPWLDDPRRSGIIRRSFSVLLVAIAVWLFLSTRYPA
jgi:threonine/homoserine/homoserine lactone efflux protein